MWLQETQTEQTVHGLSPRIAHRFFLEVINNDDLSTFSTPLQVNLIPGTAVVMTACLDWTHIIRWPTGMPRALLPLKSGLILAKYFTASLKHKQSCILIENAGKELLLSTDDDVDHDDSEEGKQRAFIGAT